MNRETYKRYVWRWWLGGGALFILLLVLLRGILLPFVVGLLIAYFLDPVVDRVERLKIGARTLGRGFSTFFVLILFYIILGVLGSLLFPLLYHQVTQLLTNLPVMIQTLRGFLDERLLPLVHRLDPKDLEQIRAAAQQAGGSLSAIIAGFMQGVWHSGLALVNVMALLFVTPVVSFYLLRDWDAMMQRLDTLLPRQQAPVIRQQVVAVDRAVAGFLRGQTNVCAILAVYYALALTLFGLDYGLLIGLATGLLTFLPYVGALFGTITAGVLAYLQFGDMSHVGGILAVFGVAQIVEGNFLTPRLVGNSIGLHPVWLIFGLLAGGALFGFVGVLIAAPVTAAVGVLVRFFVDQYRHSALYDSAAPLT